MDVEVDRSNDKIKLQKSLNKNEMGESNFNSDDALLNSEHCNKFKPYSSSLKDDVIPQEESKKKKIWNWIIQIVIWRFLQTSYRVISKSTENTSILALTIFVVFMLYLINAFFFSPTYQFLKHMIRFDTFFKYMEKISKTNPEIIMKCENYHRGDSKSCFSSNKIVTHTEIKNFEYSSSRDISGKLKINKIGDNLKKNYVKLTLNKLIKFYDEYSKSDLEVAKDYLLRDNKGRDMFYNYSEEVNLKGYEPRILVRLNEKQDPLINTVGYFMFTVVIPVVELYKLYLDIKCEKVDFTVVKLISSKNDLRIREFDEELSRANPGIKINGNMYDLKYDEPYVPSINKRGGSLSVREIDNDEFKQPLLE